ncbi:MAG: HIT family protein [bacterium]|jgi:diadenosine tetraphosphate (Ap4A) HIT family hydrolase|nr:HIT family protein [candidate division KSB1 bacterium]MDH7559421.1 HIT family protein [bacterium]
MAECVFCEIVAGSRPASVVHRDQQCWAFLDIRPVNPGHVLVIPAQHASGLADLDPEAGAQMFRVAQKVARALRASGLRCEGVNLHLADGRAAGQEVFHVHLHVVPRYRGDGFGLRFGPDYGRLAPRAKLDAIAASLQAALHSGR